MAFVVVSARTAFAHEVKIRVDRGDGLTEIAEKLKESGLITSIGFFKIYSFLTGAAHRFQPGIYTFTDTDTFLKIIRALKNPPQQVQVVVTEGLTMRDIDEKVTEAGILKKGELIAYLNSNAFNEVRRKYWFASTGETKRSIEGFLFPDTYKFSPGSTAAVVAIAMLDNFQLKAAPLLSGKSNWYTIIILASLLEKEVSLNADRAIVSGILHKRLARNMLLQVDATVTYLKCGGEYAVCAFRQLQKSDFKIDSPYNSYLYKGLPPTPIANPGLEALRAALAPKASPYLFYLSDPKTGATIFARDLDEQSRNRFRYLNL